MFGEGQPHESPHFLEFLPKFIPHLLEFMANDRMAFRDLSDVAVEGFCYDAKVAFDFLKLIRRHLSLHG